MTRGTRDKNDPMTEPSKWARIIAADPDHSQRYIERFKIMEAAGHDLAGEVRTVDAMVPRGSAHPGRRLRPRARRWPPAARWATWWWAWTWTPPSSRPRRRTTPDPPGWSVTWPSLISRAAGVEADFDVIIAAGNVMGFLAPSTRVEVLRRFGTHLAPEGRAIIGFGGGRGYEFANFFADVDAAGLRAGRRAVHVGPAPLHRAVGLPRRALLQGLTPLRPDRPAPGRTRGRGSVADRPGAEPR